MESPILNAIVIIAAGSAVIRFALYEWEGIISAWGRASKRKKRRKRQQ
jgi:hypothetical protein